ncbi:hypothetical protein QJS10_CPB17g01537 [Acorus calamus]|uniref:Reverse transcriptase domain-containing protein n=1 Tax=Acorus calamus TaxID=4465 RepID=A0AAV9CSW9_ACOCL|nr:hypothetical protein QJS10_CPB17g01537 [Acorus calamus]
MKQVHGESQEHLEEPFSEEEIKRACFDTDGDKAPGPDGFGLQFYHRLWEMVRSDVLGVFDDYFDNGTGMGCINASTIVLLKKKEGAVRIEDFMPICLLNGCYLLLAKVLANRLRSACEEIIDQSQLAFLPDRSILEGFTITQELVAALHLDSRSGVLLKLDFLRAYDNVDFPFLLHLMQLHGFNERWCRMNEQCIGTARASITVNGEPFGFFPLNKGLRQGNPMSPVLFSLVANAFCLMCKAAASEEWIKGLSICPGCTKIHIAQYTDDTMLFGSPTAPEMEGYRFIIECFGLLSGLHINYSKSALVPINIDTEAASQLAEVTGCTVEHLPIRHLRLPTRGFDDEVDGLATSYRQVGAMFGRLVWTSSKLCRHTRSTSGRDIKSPGVFSIHISDPQGGSPEDRGDPPTIPVERIWQGAAQTAHGTMGDGVPSAQQGRIGDP